MGRKIFLATSAILLLFTSGQLVAKEQPKTVLESLPASANDEIRQVDQWLRQDFKDETRLIAALRQEISKNDAAEINQPSELKFDPNCSAVAVTLYQIGQKPLRVISQKTNFKETVTKAAQMLSANARLKEFDYDDPKKCRILFEIIKSQRPLDIYKLTGAQFTPNRFEPGITGFKVIYKDNPFYYMPTDAVTQSEMTAAQALDTLGQRMDVGTEKDSDMSRVDKLRKLDAQWFLIESQAIVSFGEEVIPLYRGYPARQYLTKDNLQAMVIRSNQWLLDNMWDDGRFLYYYDGVRDSIIDHVHPNRDEDDNYYNILRHSGGVIALLRANEIDPDKKYTKASEKALDHLVGTLREQDYKGRKAYYVFDNKKSKLGGSGIGLAAMLRYRQATGDKKYDKYIHGLADHILSRICDDGEMIGYYIHPLYNHGNPILDPNDQDKKKLFSFYYPGEAMLGLALYDKQMKLSDERHREIREQSAKAIDFLVLKRPVKYKEMFQPLPSDGWLMQAIEEWSDIKEFRKDEYLNFVYSDANAMISHMYTYSNNPYYDYPGTFYYNYGDHAYIDGARSEGLISAYYLAKKMDNKELAKFYLDNCKTAARSLMFSYNSPESTYFYKNPAKAIGSFRFKLTRQWMRVDTVQHTACFYSRLIKAMGRQKW